jgi:hypothetical protein
MEAGEVGIGLHAGYPLEAANASGFPLFVSGVARVGLGKGLELGLNAGTLGIEGTFKVGFSEPEDKLQVSLITGVNYLYWDIFGINAGVVGGYTVRDVVRPYAGYRHYWLWPDVWMGDIIGGMEILISEKAGLTFEFNHTVTYSSYDKYLEEITGLNPDISYGINVVSGGFFFRL